MVNYNTSLSRPSPVSDVMLTDCIARKHEPLVNKNKNYISFFLRRKLAIDIVTLILYWGVDCTLLYKEFSETLFFV